MCMVGEGHGEYGGGGDNGVELSSSMVKHSVGVSIVGAIMLE